MFIIKGLLDRVCFTLGVLLFMQVPHFIDQYTQRLGGYHQAQLKHLNQYQEIANQQHRGDLEALIREFESSKKKTVQETGKNVRIIRDEAASLVSDVHVLEKKQFIFKLLHLVSNTRYDVAKETLRIYKPGIPFSIEGIVCGFLGGILMSLFFNGCCIFPRLFKSKDDTSKSTATTAMRIEPSVTRAKRLK